MKPVLSSRRTFMGGTGVVALGLPFLESALTSREARAAQCRPPRRFVTYFVPNGVWMGGWSIPATQTTSAFTMSSTLAAIASIAPDTLIINGLHNQPGIPTPGGGSHGTGAAGLLTCEEWKKTAGKVGTSMDQVAADAIGGCTPASPSLQLGVEKHGSFDEIGVPSLAHTTLSWRDSRPLPKITDPAQAFNRLFQGRDPGKSAAAAERRRMLDSSILDHVLGEQKSLVPRLGTSDRRKLDDYFQSVRELESRTRNLKPVTCGAASMPPTGDYRANLEAMHEIMALAFQCDATRIITFQAADPLRTSGMPWVNVGDPHGATHGGDVMAVQRVDRWRLEQYVRFIKRLAGIMDPDGRSVLANSAVYYCSEVASGGRHSNENKPTLISGQLGGAIKTGRLLLAGRPKGDGRDGTWDKCDESSRSCADQQSVANLYLALLQGLGVAATRFMNSTAPLALA